MCACESRMRSGIGSLDRLTAGRISRFIPDRERPDPNPDSGAKHWVSKDREAIHTNKDCAVSDPGSMHPCRDHSAKLGGAGSTARLLSSDMRRQRIGPARKANSASILVFRAAAGIIVSICEIRCKRPRADSPTWREIDPRPTRPQEDQIENSALVEFGLIEFQTWE